MIQSIERYNGLKGQVVTREQLKFLIDAAVDEDQAQIVNKLVNVLLTHPEYNKFKFDEVEELKLQSTGLGKPKTRVGIEKIALDSCGRLVKGFKFQNGKIVAAAATKKPSSPSKKPSLPSKKPSLPSKLQSIKSKILALKSKYNLNEQLPKITKGLNGYLADGHMILTESDALIYNDQFEGLNAAAKDVEQIVNELILDKINTGAALPPWKQSWATKSDVLAQNFETKQPYTGSNATILNVLLGSIMPTPYYLTMNQIEKMKGQVKKGAKSIPLVYYNFFYTIRDLSKNPAAEAVLLSKINGYEVKRKGKKSIFLGKTNYTQVTLNENEVNFLGLEKTEYLTKAFLKYYRVFNIADTEGIPYELPDPSTKSDTERIAIAEAIVKGFTDKPKIGLNKKEAIYNKVKDTVDLPDIGDFTPKEEYYSTLFHELIHSTMHENRLNRIEKYKNKDKNAEYAFEELIAELGASYLCGIAGILDVVHLNSAAYLKGWHKKLQGYTETYSDFFIYATREAQKAVDYILKGYNENEAKGSKPETNNDKDKAKAKAKALILKLKLKAKAGKV